MYCSYRKSNIIYAVKFCFYIYIDVVFIIYLQILYTGSIIKIYMHISVITRTKINEYYATIFVGCKTM